VSKAPTLVTLLEEFAQSCESGDWGDLAEDADRLRGAAARIAKEFRAWDATSMEGVTGEIVTAALERINGGPL
jgi:hypothetical protein